MNEKINALLYKKASDIIKRKNDIVESYIEANLAALAVKDDMTLQDMVKLIQRASLTINQEGNNITYTFKLKPGPIAKKRKIIQSIGGL
jgi:hypothetical protein